MVTCRARYSISPLLVFLLGAILAFSQFQTPVSAAPAALYLLRQEVPNEAPPNAPEGEGSSTEAETGSANEGEESGEGERTHGGEICPSKTSCLLRDAPKPCTAEELEEGKCGVDFTILVFPLIALVGGVLATPISNVIKVLPYTLVLLFIGALFGLLGCEFEMGLFGASLKQWVHLDPPEAFFFVFLAPLIFEASFNTEYHVFRRLLIPIITAAFAIVIAQVFLIGLFQLKIVRTEDWNIWSALMFGSMLSATDPISVTATLKSVGASEYLNVLIEGESLVNDGSAFVLWEAFFENTESGEGELLGPGEIILKVLKLSLGGVGLGLLFGLLALIVLTLVYDEFEIETSITVIVAFLGFWTAQSPAKLSGVICNVTSGLILSGLGKGLITSSVRGPLDHVWELLGWAANTIVFVHAGVLVTAFIWSCAGEPHGTSDYLYIFGYYAYLQFIRVGLFYLFYPILSWKQEWFTWKEALVVGASGLRGAVSLVLALKVASVEAVPTNVRTRVVLWTTSIVALSLLINGLIIKPMLTLLGMDRADKTKEDFLRRARSLMLQKTLMILDALCTDQAFKAVRWSYVRDNVMPKKWLSIAHTGSYENALSHLQGARLSIQSVQAEVRRSIDIHALEQRISVGDPLTSPPQSPAFSNYTPRFSAVSPRFLGASVPRHSFDPAYDRASNAMDENFNLGANHADSHGDDARHSHFGTPGRMSFVSHTGPRVERTESEVLREVHELRKRKEAGEVIKDGPLEVEVRRRFLVSALSHLRRIFKATLVEYSALLDLEEDFQNAIDANDNGRVYNLFHFVEKPGWKGWLERSVRLVTEQGGSKGETAIVTAHVIVSVLTQVLKEPFLQQSPIIFAEVEEDYEWASTLLNRLEAINPSSYSWVQATFAVQLTYRRQDAVLSDLLHSGAIDTEEHKVMYEEMAETRRHYSLWASRRFNRPKKISHETKIRSAPLFVGLSEEEYRTLVRRPGKISRMQAGEKLRASEGALVFVVEGAIRVGEVSKTPRTMHVERSKKLVNKLHQLIDNERQEAQSAAIQTRASARSVSEFGTTTASESQVEWSDRDAPALADTYGPLARPRLSIAIGSSCSMHWCFPENNAFCGAEVNVTIEHICRGNLHRLPKTIEFYSCDIAHETTVFWLPLKDLAKVIQANDDFRNEIARMIAREIVLETVAQEPPYALSHISTVSLDYHDGSLVGRAMHALERLPYMRVSKLRSDDRHAVHGPGVLLYGTVKVSVVDSSGLVGAANLLHERLTGPALLPAGGLIIETSDDLTDSDEVPDDDDKDAHKPEDGILAYVLAEEVTDLNNLAELRLKRWTAPGPTVDMNGRFGAYRHIDLETGDRRDTHAPRKSILGVPFKFGKNPAHGVKKI